MHLDHFRLRLYPDIRNLADLVDQVLRHAFLERVSPHQHRHRARELREVDRRLARRVCASNEVHVLAAAQLSFRHRRAVVDAGLL
jgi:hypothetical protein